MTTSDRPATRLVSYLAASSIIAWTAAAAPAPSQPLASIGRDHAVHVADNAPGDIEQPVGADPDDSLDAGAPPAISKGKTRKQAWGEELRVDIATPRVRPFKDKEHGRQVLVVLPVGYDAPENASRRYPVLYLLHGSPGRPSNFISIGHWPSLLHDLTKRAAAQPPILVIPDGNAAGVHYGDSEWANSADGRDMFEDYVVKDVVPWADANLRTTPDAAHRILGGVSEGGYGAVNVAMRNPTVFGGVMALSGYYRNDGSGWARQIMGHDPAFLRRNSPLDYLAGGLGKGKNAAGWRDIHFFLGAGSDEGHYVEETRAMAERMKDAGLTVDLRVGTGKHGWELWNQLFANAVPLLLPSK